MPARRKVQYKRARVWKQVQARDGPWWCRHGQKAEMGASRGIQNIV